MSESSGKITCKECGAQVHIIDRHLKQSHPEMSLADYKVKYPGEPVMSAEAIEMLKKQLGNTEAVKPVAAPVGVVSTEFTGAAAFAEGKRSFHEVFGLGKIKAAMSAATGNPIPVTCYSSVGSPEMVGAVDDNYIFDIDELKNAMLALELKIPLYIYGHKGSGKTEMLEQIAARTGRPIVRVQHTINTEESHVVGQWAVKSGETVFHLGPLPLAMMNGWLYLADEYDFALPSMTSVYQAVLEGKPLYIKEAPPELRLIKPHPNFRFAATGNTNGSGDETGLYQGTNVQNSANYDRFGMVIAKSYLARDVEVKILRGRTGIVEEDAKRMVEFATMIRTAYHDGKINDTISPRTLINAIKIGFTRQSFRQGLTLSFTNKLTSIDRKIAEDISQRIFS